MFSVPIHLGRTRGRISNRTEGIRERVEETRGGKWVEKVVLLVVGGWFWEHQLVPIVLQQSQSKENNTGWFMNLIGVLRHTPVSAPTPAFITLPPTSFTISLQRRAQEQRRKSPWHWASGAHRRRPRAYSREWRLTSVAVSDSRPPGNLWGYSGLLLLRVPHFNPLMKSRLNRKGVGGGRLQITLRRELYSFVRQIVCFYTLPNVP